MYRDFKKNQTSTEFEFGKETEIFSETVSSFNGGGSGGGGGGGGNGGGSGGGGGGGQNGGGNK